MKRYEFEIESLSPQGAVEKLRRAGIPLLSARRTQKNAVAVAVDGKDRKKVFAILRGTCYNIKNVRACGPARLLRDALGRIGLIAGLAAAIPMIAFAESRVLRVEVEGSGAYLFREIGDILEGADVRFFSPLPKDTGGISAAVLSLPRVCFCSVEAEGGVLTVHVEVAGGGTPSAERPLCAPLAGRVEEIVVLRGTPLVSVGDEVEAGQELVGGYALYGEEIRPAEIVARVRIVYPVHAEYKTDEAGARAQAELDFGEIDGLRLTPTEGGFLAEGEAHADLSSRFY